MNWGQPDFLDSRTWISTLPDDIISHLSEYGEEETERVLTKFGPSEWIKALCNQEIMPAKKIRKQGWQSLFPVESLTEEDVLSLAIYWTRCQMCIKLSTETEIFQTSIPAKNSRNELDYAGIKAAKLLTEPPHGLFRLTTGAIFYGPHGDRQDTGNNSISRLLILSQEAEV